MIRDVDVIVIGSGQGGVPLAIELAREGKCVVLFERGAYGGTCVNTGCTPSKAFLASAHSAGRARRGVALGIHAAVTVDFPFVMHRVRATIADWSGGVHQKLKDADVELVHAEASFTGERTVTGGGVTVRAPIVVIDTGGTAVVPPVDGLAQTGYLDNSSFFQQHTLPRRFGVLGGGYIGLELGQGMARLGSEVHVIHPNARVLDAEEPDASAALEASLLEDGMHLHLNSRCTAARREGDEIVLTMQDGSTLAFDALLVATGRRPNTAALNCEAGGIALDERGYVKVDDYLRTSSDGVFALGDVAGQPAFTHVSWEDHRRVLATLRGEPRRRDDLPLAYTTFTEPQVARAGLTLEAARIAERDAIAVTLPLSSVARAIEWNDERGFFRIVVDRTNDRIIGASFVGYEAGELIHAILPYIAKDLTWRDLAAAMHVHPTYAEGLPSLARLVPAALSTASKA